MPSLFAIMKLSLRAILREKVALSMGALLLAVLFLLPSGLRTDGTLQGGIRMHLLYSLGTSFVLLSGMTLWVSCATVSGDLANKRLQMVLTKPVHRWTVWLGKWMAVVLLITTLGFLCGGVTWFRVHRLVREYPTTEGTDTSFILQAKEANDMELPDNTKEAKVLLAEKQASGEIPSNLPEEATLVWIMQIKQFLRVQQHAADAGATQEWTFPLSRPLTTGEQLQIAYAYESSSFSDKEVPGSWSVSAADENPPIEKTVKEVPQGTYLLDIQIPEYLAGAEALRITYTNLSWERDKVFFKTDRGVRILREGGSFAGNLGRAVLVFSGLLAILAALGVSAGSVFSLPVACYSTAMVLVAQAFSGVITEVLEEGMVKEDVHILMQALLGLRSVAFQGLLFLLEPLQVENPLSRVAEGILIAPQEVVTLFAFRLLPILLIIAIAGTGVFSRREIGGAV